MREQMAHREGLMIRLFEVTEVVDFSAGRKNVRCHWFVIERKRPLFGPNSSLAVLLPGRDRGGRSRSGFRVLRPRNFLPQTRLRLSLSSHALACTSTSEIKPAKLPISNDRKSFEALLAERGYHDMLVLHDSAGNEFGFCSELLRRRAGWRKRRFSDQRIELAHALKLELHEATEFGSVLVVSRLHAIFLSDITWRRECNMGRPSHDELDLIQDPETGLALLAKRPGEETPVQERQPQFWQSQFAYWQAWRAGDVEAFARAVTCCTSYNRPPPLWLCRAGYELYEQCRPDDEKREHGDLRKHFLRWEAVEPGARAAPREIRATTKRRFTATLFGRRRRSSWRAGTPRPAPRRCAKVMHWSGAPAARWSRCRTTGARWSGGAKKKSRANSSGGPADHRGRTPRSSLPRRIPKTR